MNPFERAVHLDGTADSRGPSFRGAVPEGWATGRGAFGGLVLGYLVKAIEATETSAAEASPVGSCPRRLRSFTGAGLTAVLPGTVVARTRVLRRGKHQSNVQATLEQDGQLVATGSAVLSGARPSPLVPFAMDPPQLGELPLLPFLVPAGPSFAPRFALRSRCHQPFTCAGEPYVEGYIAEQGERAEPFDGAAITALLDAWWPVILQTFDRPRLVATVAFTSQYVKDPASLPRDARLAMRARAVAGGEGFVLEMRELWWERELVATMQQTLALLS